MGLNFFRKALSVLNCWRCEMGNILKSWTWVDWLIIVALVVLNASAWSDDLRAAEVTDDQAATVYALAHSVSHLPLPEKAPTIHMVSGEALQLIACGSTGMCQGIRAMQVGQDIFLDQTLDMSTPRNATILLHEFVHYLQWAKGGMPKNCAEWRDREIVAYQVQNEVLYKIGEELVPPYLKGCRDNATPQKFEDTFPVLGLTGQEDWFVKARVHKIQSEMLDPARVKAIVCEYRKQLAEYVIYKARHGLSKDHFWALNPLPKDWSAAQKTRVSDLVDEAYVWPRGAIDFVDQVGRDCQAE